MKSHLETFKAALHLLSPVFIGAGRDITKKEFIFDPASNQVHIPDFHKLVNFLDKARLLDAYESFMQSTVGDLRTFLSQNRITPEQYPEFTVYNYAAGDALDQYHTLTGIQLFMQDGTGKPYIPGSSLKGALRTALLAEILSKESPQNHINTLQKMKASLAEKSFKRDLNRLSDEIEQKHFHRLALNERRPFDAVNSVLKGLQISDSAPLNHKDLILCKKIDVNKEGLTRSINTCRECLRPNTRVEFVITLDNAILSRSEERRVG